MKTNPQSYISVALLLMILLSACKKDNDESKKIKANPCDGITTLTYHGQTYNLVEIGDQCWMAENLNYEVPNSWCYGDNNSFCDTYGRLYTWDAAMNGQESSDKTPSGVQGICPPDWHLPSHSEWSILIKHLGGPAFAGGKMKEVGFEHWSEPNNDATNESGFTGLPGGYRKDGDRYYNKSYEGRWWTATKLGNFYAWFCFTYYSYGEAHLTHSKIEDGFSVRCVKD